MSKFEISVLVMREITLFLEKFAPLAKKLPPVVAVATNLSSVAKWSIFGYLSEPLLAYIVLVISG